MRTVVWLVYAPLSVAILLAFLEALELWLLWPAVASAALFALLWLLGPIGAVLIAPIAFYGAFQGWGWAWWQALALAGGFVALGFFAMAFSGVLGLVGRRTGALRRGETRERAVD